MDGPRSSTSSGIPTSGSNRRGRGRTDRLGLGDAVAWEVNSKLVIVHVSGFGQTGEPARVAAPSYDLIGQAFSGYLSLQGKPDPEPPMRAGTALNDTVTGLAAATAALMAYVHATRTGRGQSVDVAQYEMFFVLLENLALDYFARGVVRGRHGTAHPRLHPYDVHASQDGWVVVAAPTQPAWERLAEMIGPVPPSWTDPSFRRGTGPRSTGRSPRSAAAGRRRAGTAGTGA